MSSPALNVLVRIAGVAMPIIAWASHRAATTNMLLAVETMLVLFFAINHIWLRRTHIYLRRPTSHDMSDPRYFDLVCSHLESDLIADFDEIADGHLSAYAANVPRLSILLLQTLIDSPAQPKHALATDLAAPPGLLAAPREYLAANRRLIEAGGEIRRIFICWTADPITEQYVRELQELIDNQRPLGVYCGLAIRDRLRAEQTVDFIVISQAAMVVQEDRGDLGFTRGRTSIHFKNVDRWAKRYESIWVTACSPPPQHSWPTKVLLARCSLQARGTRMP
jgi:hypothetical protein